jgi:ATP-dependent exoDNAse (exonuclease V) alpha subunit
LSLLFSDSFSRINSDPAQRSAAEKILSNPVTVISGRGGTGKTEVVTAVLDAAEKVWHLN